MSLHQVKVGRQEVLEIVRENKKKHDALLKDAVEGFWTEAEKQLKKYEKDSIAGWERSHKERLKKMRKELRDNKKNLKEQVKKELGFVEGRKKDAPWVYMSKKYPENHADDYVGTIRRLELCVEKEVELDTTEFDRYVRNKWEWRASFLNNNTGYVTAFYSSSPGCSGSYSSLFGTGSCGISSSWASSSLSLPYAGNAPQYSLTASWVDGAAWADKVESTF